MNSIILNIRNRLNSQTVLRDIPVILNSIPSVNNIENLKLPYGRNAINHSNSNDYFKEEIFKNTFIRGFIIYWKPHALTPIHNHGNLGCFFKPLSRGIIERRYNSYEDTNYVLKRECDPTITHYIDNKIGLHSVENINDYVASSIHIYQNDL